MAIQFNGGRFVDCLTSSQIGWNLRGSGRIRLDCLILGWSPTDPAGHLQRNLSSLECCIMDIAMSGRLNLVEMMMQLVQSSWILHCSCNKRRIAPIAALLSSVLHPSVFSDVRMHEMSCVAFDEDFEAELSENQEATLEVSMLSKCPNAELAEVFINTEMYARVAVAVLFDKLANLVDANTDRKDNADATSALLAGKMFLLELLDSA
ncbi:hypothetical protein Taro_018339, partial [Colocasia esculenta]|nr:hypothetical protein [Colocasia esculenta]